MTITLIRKLLRDLRVALLVVAVLLGGFQCLWVKITQRTSGELVPLFLGLAAVGKMKPEILEKFLFKGPGKIMQTLMGGESIQLDHAMHMLSIGYVHPLMQTIFCIWAIGRAAGAIAGEIDRGTMELLLAQPVPRGRLVLAHLCVDLLTIPVLCLALWGGTWLGTWLVGPIEPNLEGLGELAKFVRVDPEALRLYPAAIGPGLVNVFALIFAVSGYTMWISAAGRFRWRVMGAAVLLTLVQFLINVIGQLWDVVAPLRPLTVFFYYQPQQIILSGRWTVDLGQAWNGGQPLYHVNGIAVLLLVGVVGYALALGTFSRRDLPAPL
jgi:ABC-2 type transport system permease protein